MEQLTKAKNTILYPYQAQAVTAIWEVIKGKNPAKLIYQLPTGGGKTLIFSELAKRYVRQSGKKVLILTHRVELSVQTEEVLQRQELSTLLISNKVKEIDQNNYDCFVAMIETLHNRLDENCFDLSQIGMIIVDEAHYNYFRKIFRYFAGCNLIGFTATPISSNIHLPLSKDYDQILVGENISALVEQGYLTKAITYTFDVDLKSLKIGINGDFTVSSSEKLYSSELMMSKLLHAYEDRAKGKKTLIFNSSINTSRLVEQFFIERGYDHKIQHLDSTFSDRERKQVLEWFNKTKGAILTSVGILTTGFDEPSVEVILLNRATRSIALYHQMVGRGSRIYPNKKNFYIIDLGNNAKRFGLWEDVIDWHKVFKNPTWFLEQHFYKEENELDFSSYERPNEIAERFPNTPENPDIHIRNLYKECSRKQQKTILVIDQCIENHLEWIQFNASVLDDALELFVLLKEEIQYRIHAYGKCINASNNYLNWLTETYEKKIERALYLHYDE